jgi:glycosyltransferase 2 family protein
MTPRRWTLTAISFLFAIGASVYIIRSSWSQEGARVGLPLWAHAACLAAAALELLTRAIKIRLSGTAVRIPFTVWTAIRVSLGGDFAGAITPAKSGTEPARFLVLREAGLPAADALVILFLELFLEMLSLATLAAVLAFVLGGSSTEVRGLLGMVGAYSTFVIGGGILGYIAARKWSAGPPPPWTRRFHLGDDRWRHIQRSLRHLRVNVVKLRSARWWVLAGALVFSILHVLMRLTVLPIVVWSLGVRTALGPLVLWPLAIIYGGAVAPAPAGGGLIEVAFRGALGGHIPAPVFGAALLWWRVYTFYILLVGGALVTGAAVMRSLRRNGVVDDEID